MTVVKHAFNNIPPLESGDKLTRHEFERRYTAMPDNTKAELIAGIVYMASPLRFRSHGQPHGNLIIWLGTYKIATPGVELGDNVTVRLDLDNEPQPDAVLLIDRGGQARISDDDYIEGSPELVAEVAASSVSIDLHEKKQAYRRNGVQEYIVWQVLEGKLDWFSLQNGEYISLEVDTNGIVKSQIFPGLWLASTALIAGNMQYCMSVLQQGLNSTEYNLFVEQLASK